MTVSYEDSCLLSVWFFFFCTQLIHYGCTLWSAFTRVLVPLLWMGLQSGHTTHPESSVVAYTLSGVRLS